MFFCQACKNWQGGLHQQKNEPKYLKIYAKLELGERYVISVFEFYVKLSPSDGPFY